MSHNFIITTYDWVPEGPRGFVRDLRLRWAAEEAGFPYTVNSIKFKERQAGHLQSQPFGQIPVLTDGELTLFESGACLLHIARQSEVLFPRDPDQQEQTVQWVVAALNSLEMVTVPWWFLKMKGEEASLTGWLEQRLQQMEAVLSQRDWLVADRFTVADLLMADVLRIPDVRAHGKRPATEGYIRRLTARPAFLTAQTDQLAHFAKADQERADSRIPS